MCNKELHLLEIVEHHKCKSDSIIPFVKAYFLILGILGLSVAGWLLYGFITNPVPTTEFLQNLLH